MSTIAAGDTPAFNFKVHPSALKFAITRRAHAQIHAPAGYGLVATGALVFDTSDTRTPRVLLVQRSACDTMPNKWEVPGGACDDEDPTILYAVARELWEEAGLRASHIREAVGNPHVFVSGSGKPICKLNFVVEAETNADGTLQPTLDPKEHQQFVWASKAEVRSKKVGDIELDFTSDQLEDAILQTFEELARE